LLANVIRESRADDSLTRKPWDKSVHAFRRPRFIRREAHRHSAPTRDGVVARRASSPIAQKIAGEVADIGFAVGVASGLGHGADPLGVVRHTPQHCLKVSRDIGINVADWSYVAEGPQPDITAEPIVGLWAVL
jgi:hypothetical protein